MPQYGYDENEHLRIEAEAIDKDGFHKKVEISNESEPSTQTRSMRAHFDAARGEDNGTQYILFKFLAVDIPSTEDEFGISHLPHILFYFAQPNDDYIFDIGEDISNSEYLNDLMSIDDADMDGEDYPDIQVAYRNWNVEIPSDDGHPENLIYQVYTVADNVILDRMEISALYPNELQGQ